jgi:hypothetical protein
MTYLVFTPLPPSLNRHVLASEGDVVSRSSKSTDPRALHLAEVLAGGRPSDV